MIIRPAQARDLDVCLAFDDSYETEYVWQVDSARTGDGGAFPRGSSIQMGFRVTRLPRAMRVGGSSQRASLLDHFERGDCFLVAEEGKALRGYLDATVDSWRHIVWIEHLTVPPEARRQGIGSSLLRRALEWAHARNVPMAMVEMQTKNYPATALFQKFGFVFCGYNDHYYANRDIALFFALNLK